MKKNKENPATIVATTPAVTIAMGEKMRNEIYTALQGEVVEALLQEAGVAEGTSYFRSAMEGHSLKVEKRLLPKLYDIFEEVRMRLNFNEKVDFYITGDSNVNAFSVAAEKDGDPHIVNVNSALIDLMTDDELRFVIGHELGHLIDRDTELLQLIGFVFPDGTSMPLMLRHKVRLWQQLAELSADRFGYLAAGDLGVCVSAFYKMASGLDIARMNVQLDVLLEENLRHLEYFLHDEGVSEETHPVNPIRVQSLNLYATLGEGEELEKQMNELISILLKIGDSRIGKPMAVFLATAGLFAASADGEVTEKEINAILDNLASTTMFPQPFLEQIAASDNASDLFTDAVGALLSDDPSLREALFTYLIQLVLADKKITAEEMQFLYEVGENVFSYSRKETALMTAQLIQLQFVPTTESLC